MKNWENRINSIKDNLYSEGGHGQAISLLDIMLSPFGNKNFKSSDIDPKDVLDIIGRQIDTLRKMIYDGGFISLDVFETMFNNIAKKGESYACLDKNLNFCVKQYATENWIEIKYVFPYMNASRAFDIIGL